LLGEVDVITCSALFEMKITDSVAKWEFSPAAVDNVPVPICLTVAVNVNGAAQNEQA